MNFRFEATNAKEADEAVEHFWGVFSTIIGSDGANIEWEFDFICGDVKYGVANFSVVCSSIVLTSDFVREE